MRGASLFLADLKMRLLQGDRGDWARAKGRSLLSLSAGKPTRKGGVWSAPHSCSAPVSTTLFLHFPWLCQTVSLGARLPTHPWRAGLGCTHVWRSYMLLAGRGAGECGTSWLGQKSSTMAGKKVCIIGSGNW